jgi:hypothetical protein
VLLTFKEEFRCLLAPNKRQLKKVLKKYFALVAAAEKTC